MPTVGVKRDELYRLLGQVYTEEEFDELCFEFGLELDEVTSERQMLLKERGDTVDSTALKEASETVIYKLDVPANRYDLLSLEGLGRSLLVFLGKIKPPVYRAVVPSNGGITITVDPSVAEVRPHVIGAVLRDITFTPERYASFIDLQDKLHMNLCRRRTLVSMGTHDLDSLSSMEIVYRASAPKDISFIPLNGTEKQTAERLMTVYQEGHLKSYLSILEGKRVYPTIEDTEGVISWPPITNSDRTKIHLGTRNVFVEVTATDIYKAEVVLDNFVSIFCEYCADPYSVERIRVVRPGGEVTEYPRLTYTEQFVSLKYINSRLGLNLLPEECTNLLGKMSLVSKHDMKTGNLKITVPPTRTDIIHPCDIIEDVAIAFGYNNLDIVPPKTVCTAEMFPLNSLTDLLRLELAMSGFTEALTFALCSRDDVSTKLRKDLKTSGACHVSNPKTLEFQVARTSLLPGVLKTVSSNKSVPLPIKLFEVSDVVLVDSAAETGARNLRRLCAVNYATSPGFEVIHGLLDRIMQVLNVEWDESDSGKGYSLRESADESFFPGRRADIWVNNTKVGVLGVLHPEVITNFDLNLPAAALEMDVEHFL